MVCFPRVGVALAAGLLAALFTSPVQAQEWRAPVRGSWVRTAAAQPGDVTLADDSNICEIVLDSHAASPVQQAAVFLASDLEKITGKKPAIVNTPTAGKTAIHLVTLDATNAASLPKEISTDKLQGEWEAYQLLTAADGKNVWLVGADARGSAYAAYTLSERLGIDPLYLWTGYTPERHTTLVLSHINGYVAPPTIKYRGMFHDDEDILPRPFEDSGYPLRIGDVPTAWYKKFFETALRLRMNMVAPYTRVHRRFEVQKIASDWGLYFTSHHYDVLLSNPFGYRNFKLAEARGVTGNWDWFTNRENMLKYWSAGVKENGGLDCIWPVGLRGTDDVGYNFPKGTSQADQDKVFHDVINAQCQVTKELVPENKRPPAFAFTLYGEMLDKFLAAGTIDLPEDVTIIWPDDNDGRMRALPKDVGKWKHGIYYHLAYYGPVAKQTMHMIEPTRIADQFKEVVDHGVTDYMLVNVSELREFVREARMIAEISWDAKTALSDTPSRPMPAGLLPHVPTLATSPLPPDEPSASADRYSRWFATEYFGKAAADDATEAYRQYEELLTKWDRQWYAGDRCVAAIDSLIKRNLGQTFSPAAAETLPTLEDLDARYRKAFAVVERAESKMDRAQKQFFFENCELPLRVTGYHTQAAIKLVKAMSENDPKKAWALCEEAMQPLEQLETLIARAEHPPFERWYAKTFIRNDWSGLNWHKPYEVVRVYLSSGGTEHLEWPEAFRRPNLQQFLPLLKETY